MVKETNKAQAIALHALGWTVGDEARAGRFLAMTGLTPDTLRDRIGDPALLAAALRFLEGYEPDLLACADAIGVAPPMLVEARRELEA